MIPLPTIRTNAEMEDDDLVATYPLSGQYNRRSISLSILSVYPETGLTNQTTRNSCLNQMFICLESEWTIHNPVLLNKRI